MASAVASATGTFIPDHNATGGMIVGFSRNTKDFVINRIIEIRPVKKSVGVYLTWKSEQAARRPFTDAADRVWADGADRPTGIGNLEEFEYAYYKTERYAYAFTLGQKAVEQADWAIQPAHTGVVSQQCMTDRSILAMSALDGATWNDNTSAVGTITGSTSNNWFTGTPQDPYIKQSLMAGALQIHKATLGTVKPKDLILVIPPSVAEKMSRSEEVHTYLKESPFAMAQIRGDSQSNNGQWGLPDTLYGFKIEVEDTVKITAKKGATANPGYTAPTDTAFLISRPGELVGVEGGPTFSTLTMFAYEEMTVETMQDANNRRVQGSVVTDYAMVLTSPKSGYKFTGVFG
jgi:hypothetical protein